MFNRKAFMAVLALGSVAALPACSSWDRHYDNTSSAAPMAPVVSPGEVRNVQTTLQAQGYYKGSIDGLWGPATQGALQSYQSANGLVANGELTPKTLASLNAPPAVAPPPPPAPVTTSAATPVAPPAPPPAAPAPVTP